MQFGKVDQAKMNQISLTETIIEKTEKQLFFRLF